MTALKDDHYQGFFFRHPSPLLDAGGAPLAPVRIFHGHMIKMREFPARLLRVWAVACAMLASGVFVSGSPNAASGMEHDEQEMAGSRPRTGQGILSWDRFDPADNARERRWTCDDKPDPATRSVIVDPLADQTMMVSTSRVASIEQGLALLLPETGRRILYLRAGAYRLSNTLTLSSAANGMAIAACPGEVPVLEGHADAAMLILRETRDVALIGLVLSGPSPVHMRLEDARDCVIARNTFLHGSTTILLAGSSNNIIRHNLILHAAATGIELRDGSDGNSVVDNIIDGADAPETHGGGVFLHGVSHNRIARNLIQNTAGFGIGVSNWDAATVNIGNIVEFNVLRNTALTAEDSGAIYVLGRSGADTQIVIAGNVIDGVGTGAAGRHNVGIYLDDSTNGAFVTRNLVRRPGSDAVQIHGGSDNLIENNLLDLGEARPAAVLFQAAPLDTNPLNAQTGNVVVRNVILSANPDPKLFVWLDGGNPLVAGNLYANAAGAAMPLEIITDTRPVVGDPTIARNGARDHYAAAQSVAAAMIGFRPIDLSIAGPRAWRGTARPALPQ